MSFFLDLFGCNTVVIACKIGSAYGTIAWEYTLPSTTLDFLECYNSGPENWNKTPFRHLECMRLDLVEGRCFHYLHRWMNTNMSGCYAEMMAIEHVTCPKGRRVYTSDVAKRLWIWKCPLHEYSCYRYVLFDEHWRRENGNVNDRNIPLIHTLLYIQSRFPLRDAHMACVQKLLFRLINWMWGCVIKPPWFPRTGCWCLSDFGLCIKRLTLRGYDPFTSGVYNLGHAEKVQPKQIPVTTLTLNICW